VELSFEAIIIHVNSELVHVNPAAAGLLGAASPEELVGRPIRDFVHPDHWKAVQAWVQQVGEERKGGPLVEETLIRLDGSIVSVQAASVPINFQGQPAVQTVIHDITERKQAEAEREKERARIARDLHDSLGHSLGYVHLKLDRLAGDSTLGEIGKVKQELAQMRDVINKAYEVVRGMLAASRPSNLTDFTAALLAQARTVGQRGNFKVQLTSEGQPGSLTPIVQQQVLFLFREALINVERHANAQQVDISLLWAERSLTITLEDDGCGFEMAAQQPNGHYGLRIMQERTEQINGYLTLDSRPGAGTQVVLRLPLTPNIEQVKDR
jgi:PAS domain S-box-containing protein